MKFSKRALIAPMAGAMMVVGMAGSVSAQDADFNIDATALEGVCSVSLSSTDIDLGDLVWDTTNLMWPNDEEYSTTINVTLHSTGAPGDRACELSASNTGFVNDDLPTPIQLLPASALTVGGNPLSPSPLTIPNMPIPNLIVPVEFDVSTANVNQTAPADTYTSTLTVTIVNPNATP